MTKLTVMNQCYTCVHRRPIPGDCHTRCAAPWESMAEMPEGDRVGRKNGWWLFPENFDPTWHTGFCMRYEAKAEGCES